MDWIRPITRSDIKSWQFFFFGNRFWALVRRSKGWGRRPRTIVFSLFGLGCVHEALLFSRDWCCKTAWCHKTVWSCRETPRLFGECSILSWNFSIVLRVSWMVLGDFSMVPRNCVVVSQDFYVVSQNFWMVSRDFCMVSQDCLKVCRDFSIVSLECLMMLQDFSIVSREFARLLDGVERLHGCVTRLLYGFAGF